MALVNPAPIAYDTIINKLSYEKTKSPVEQPIGKGLLTRSNRMQPQKSTMSEIDRVGRYIELIKQQREELKKND
jgi:hypothetical protein